MRLVRRLTFWWLALALLGWVGASRAAADGPHPDPREHVFLTITSRFDTQQRMPEVLRAFFRAHPHVHLKQFEGLVMPGEAWVASLAMAMAANIGPDIFETDIRQAVSQGLAYPLTEWIGEDGVLANGRPKRKPDGTPDRNGQIDADEAKWDGWMQIKPLYRQVVTVDGKPYALPNRGGTYVGILYSKSLLRKAGLDPMNYPRTWDEFARWCRLLYNHETRTPGVEFHPASWAFAPWVATTGTSIVVQDRRSPTTGKVYTFNEQETDLRAPDTGEDLSAVPPTWRCNVAHPDAAAAVGFYHRLRWAPWIRDRQTGEPVELKPEEVARGWVRFQGRTIRFRKEEVIEGCLAVTTKDINETLRRMGRDLAMYPLWSGDMTEFESLGLQPNDMGMLPFPAMTAKQRPVLQASNSFFMIGKDVLRRGGQSEAEKKTYRDLVWEVMTRVCSPEGSDEIIRRKVAAGQARFLNPRDLERLGFDDYLREMPPENLQMWREIDEGRILEVVEPFMGKWLQFRDFYQREVIDLVLRPSGKEFDYQAALARLERDANTGTMFERPATTLERYRPRARVIAVLLGGILAFFLVLIIKDQTRKVASLSGVYKGWLPWVMLAPALASIALWSYYPLGRGLVMAFQNYRISGDSPWVGLNNFISIALDPNFHHYLVTTFRFVLWNLVLAFFTPILLAFLLTEVPRLKVFFRTLFFLPQMTSGLVVTLMWKEMFAGTASGTLNNLLAMVCANPAVRWVITRFTDEAWRFQPVDWLGDPRVVMACVILPGVWAGAGISSLIYLAALKSVPEELYEAAGIDGAGILRRVWHVTLPTIAPLVLINFVGAFIGTFQSMGSIFLLTFGGPGKATMVMGMAIWQEAYVNLRFSLATSYAWILGSILIAFTYLQLRILRRVDFRQATGE
ncbi:MAG: extracellular solute-binding protein [Armatimonadetes bacterium]|nr:extracellular solute-binding protein [Armatimonadota bacterium]